MKNIKILYFLLVMLSSPLSNSGCSSFLEMVNRLDGIQSGTPLSVRTTKGETLEGVVEQVLVDARTNQSYIVMRNSQGKQISRWVSDLDPKTFNGPLENVETESLIKFYSKGGNNYEGIYKGRKVVDGEDKFIIELPDGRTGAVSVSRVNENSIRIIESPMKQLSLPPNTLRPEGLELTSGQFISFQRGPERLMARVKEIKTGVAGERVSVEILSSDGSLLKLDLQGERLLSTIKSPSDNSMRNFAPLFESKNQKQVSAIVSTGPKARSSSPMAQPRGTGADDVRLTSSKQPKSGKGAVSPRQINHPETPSIKTKTPSPKANPEGFVGRFKRFFGGSKGSSRPKGLKNINVDGTGGISSLKEIHRLGLFPTEEVIVGGGKIKVGPLVKFGKDGRVGSYILVNIDGKETLRFAYRSSSQGTFRILPAQNHKIPFTPGYDKGIGEFSIELPVDVQKHMSSKLLSSNPKSIDTIDELLKDTIHQNHDYMGFYKHQGSESYIGNVVREDKVIRLGDSLEKVGGLKKADPSKVKINGSSAPDFSKPPTDTYKTISPTAGEVDVEIFKSLDGKITYSIMKDKEGKIWIGNATKVDSKLTSFGVASESVDLGAASMPRWEYWDQTPYQYRSSGSSHPIKKDYVDSWHFLKETPVIKGYYQAKGIPVP